jgi:hypothetical protein
MVHLLPKKPSALTSAQFRHSKIRQEKHPTKAAECKNPSARQAGKQVFSSSFQRKNTTSPEKDFSLL